jgi:hypothetical protein
LVRRHNGCVTAKEVLRQKVDDFSEAEAAEALTVLEGASSALDRLLADAPEDDEPSSADEDAAVAEARAELDRGEILSQGQVWGELLGSSGQQNS